MGNCLRAHVTLDDRFKDQCNTSMLECSVNVPNWDMVARGCVVWRAAVLMGAKSYAYEDN